MRRYCNSYLFPQSLLARPTLSQLLKKNPLHVVPELHEIGQSSVLEALKFVKEPVGWEPDINED